MKLETTFQLRMDQTSRSTFEAIAKKKKEAESKIETEAYDKRKAKRKGILEAKRKALNETNPFDYAITFHDELNPKLFFGQHLKAEIKKQLKLIAQDFVEELGITGLNIKDITISGSNAAYSYTPHSDLDLHILVDMSKMQDEVYAELFNAKKTLYNDSHSITIHKIPVELYVQDASKPVISLGEYSILHDKWIKFPTKRKANLDQNATRAKYEKLSELIKHGLKSKRIQSIQKILDTIKRYRQAGLDKGGEFGPENLAYKAVRSKGLITAIYALRDKLHSEVLSIENMYQNIPKDEILGEDDLFEVSKEKPYKLPKLRADRDHLIYVIINNVTKQRYVGITAMAYAGDIHRSLNRRMQKHLQRARIENKSWGLCASLRQYGPEKFTYGLLEIVRGKRPAHSREVEIIGQYNPDLNTAKAVKEAMQAINEVESGNYPVKHFSQLSEIKSDLPLIVYHITPLKNVPSIQQNGLQPQIGDRTAQIPDEQSAIYCFPDVSSAEDALMNWLGDEFDESEELAMLEIDTTGLKGKFTKHAEYELTIVSPIPPEQIKVMPGVI